MECESNLMIEILEIFWSAKIELRVVILATLVMGCVWYWQDYKRKQKEKQQERLNSIK
jgi:predicted aminopeptidase